MWRRGVLLGLSFLLMSSLAWAQRSKRPPNFTKLDDPNQLAELNNVLSDFWNITNGRYTLENISEDPNGTRKGLKGDMVYATFGGQDHLCIGTSFPIGTAWTCIDVGTLAACPAGADGQVMFNDNGTCGSDPAFIYDKNLDHAALGTDTTTGIAVINQGFDQYWSTVGGSIDATQVFNIRELLTDLATITFRTNLLGYLHWSPTSIGTIEYLHGVTGALLADGNANFLNVNFLSGLFGTARYEGTLATAGTRIAGVMGRASNNGSGKCQVVTGGRFIASNESTGTTTQLAGIYIDPLEKNGSGTITQSYGLYSETTSEPIGTTDWGIYIQGPGNNNADTFYNYLGGRLGVGGIDTPSAVLEVLADTSVSDGGTTEFSQIISKAHTVTFASGTSLTNERDVQILAPTYVGTAPGNLTITNAATFYIDAAPIVGANSTLNNRYALWSDSGVNRFDGFVDMAGSATVTGILTVGATSGASQITVNGPSGGCVMLRDTDNAGWTECDALDGTLSCSIDADGLCD